MEQSKLTRRGSLASLGGFLLALFGADRLDAAPEVACVLAPEQTEGPYYIAEEAVRRNITEGRPGTPLLLELYVVNARTCKPIKNATVDVWHADASGIYSGFGEGAGNRTFMRGVQRTNAKGVATFQTVYPGWYQGRTVHIHVKVHVGGNVVHTGQLYFPDSLTDAVYRSAPYTSRPNRTTRNANDAIYRRGGKRSLLKLRRSGAGYTGTLMMGVRGS